MMLRKTVLVLLGIAWLAALGAMLGSATAVFCDRQACTIYDSCAAHRVGKQKETTAPESPAHRAGGQQQVPDEPLSLSTICRALVRRAFVLERMRKQHDNVPSGVAVVWTLKGSRAVHEELLRMLDSNNAEQVEFAARALCMQSNHLEDVDLLRKCLSRWHLEREVAHACWDTMELMLVPGCTRWYGESPLSAEDLDEWYEKAKRWLNEHEEHWKGKSYGEYWGRAVYEWMKRACEAENENYRWSAARKAVAALSRLERVRADRQVPAQLVRCIREFSAWDHEPARQALAGVIGTLRLYVGRFDVPPDDDVDALKRERKRIVAWWEKNRNADRLAWMLDALASRGYWTDDPANVARTGFGLYHALTGGSPLDRHNAAVVYMLVLPDGDELPYCSGTYEWFADQQTTSVPREKAQFIYSPYRDFAYRLLTWRAVRWSLLDWCDYEWDPEQHKYVPRAK